MVFRFFIPLRSEAPCALSRGPRKTCFVGWWSKGSVIARRAKRSRDEGFSAVQCRIELSSAASRRGFSKTPSPDFVGRQSPFPPSDVVSRKGVNPAPQDTFSFPQGTLHVCPRQTLLGAERHFSWLCHTSRGFAAQFLIKKTPFFAQTNIVK